MSVGNNALAHESVDHRNVQLGGKLGDGLIGLGPNSSIAGQNQGIFRFGNQICC